jgi:hypothetical protein
MKSAVLSIVVFLLLISLFVYSCSNAVSPIANQTNSNFTLNVYVDVAGSDTNQGTKTSPFGTINKAISYAYDTLTKTNAQVNIYLKSGLYTEGSGFTTPITISITSPISILGGWNDDFSQVNGVSYISFSNKVDRGLYISDVSNIEVENIAIMDVSYFLGSGAGVLIKNSSGITLSNVIVSNCTSGSSGGGVYIERLADSTLYITIMNSVSLSGSGGGVFVTNSSNNNLNITAYNNNSSLYGGGVTIYNSSSNTFNLLLTNNSSGYGGGLAIVGSQSRYNKVFGSVSKNTSSLGGGGIASISDYQNTITAEIQGNSSPLGGGIYIYDSKFLVISKSYITNDSSSGSKKSVIYITNTGGTTNLIIYECSITGTTASTPWAIYEDGVDLKFHSISKNSFVYSTLGNLYHDPDDGTGNPVDIPSSAAGLGTLNTSLDPKHDANVSIANTGS